MKFGATSDLHGILPEIEPCDVFLICGDISPLNIQHDYYRMENWMRSTFAEWVNNLPCDQVICTPGNHDIYLQDIEGIDTKIYENITRPTRGKLEVLYNKETNVISRDGETCKIWGTPYCKTFGLWAFMPGDSKLAELYKEMPKNCDIVISHDPPRVGKYGTILEGPNAGQNEGNKYLAKEIKEKMPRYVLSGHIHSGCHELNTHKGYGNTKFANVSYVNESYQPVYNILYFEL